MVTLLSKFNYPGGDVNVVQLTATSQTITQPVDGAAVNGYVTSFACQCIPTGSNNVTVSATYDGVSAGAAQTVVADAVRVVTFTLDSTVEHLSGSKNIVITLVSGTTPSLYFKGWSTTQTGLADSTTTGSDLGASHPMDTEIYGSTTAPTKASYHQSLLLGVG